MPSGFWLTTKQHWQQELVNSVRVVGQSSGVGLRWAILSAPSIVVCGHSHSACLLVVPSLLCSSCGGRGRCGVPGECASQWSWLGKDPHRDSSPHPRLNPPAFEQPAPQAIGRAPRDSSVPCPFVWYGEWCVLSYNPGPWRVRACPMSCSGSDVTASTSWTFPQQGSGGPQCQWQGTAIEHVGNRNDLGPRSSWRRQHCRRA